MSRTEDQRTVSDTEDYKIFFGLTRKGFLDTHSKIKSLMGTVLPQSTGGDVLGSRTIADLTDNILKDVLRQTSSTLIKLCENESSYSVTQAQQMGSDMAEKLVDSTADKMLEYWHLCIVSNWLTAASYDHCVDPNVVIDSLSSRMAKDALSTFFQYLLSICIRQMPSKTRSVFVDSPMSRFLMDVAENAVGSLKLGASEKRVYKKYSLFSEKILRAMLGCAEEEKEEDDKDFDSEKDILEVSRSYRKTLKTETHKFIRSSILKETSKITASIPGLSDPGFHLTAKLKRCASLTSSEIVELLTSALSLIFIKNIYPNHDKSVVERISKALLKLTQDKLKEAIKTNLLLRSKQSMSTSQSAVLQAGSNRVVRRIIRDIKEYLMASLLEKTQASVPAKKFLKSMKRQLDIMVHEQIPILQPSLLTRIKRTFRQLRNRIRKMFATKVSPLNVPPTTGVQESSPPDPPSVSPPEKKKKKSCIFSRLCRTSGCSK
ncbi:hypothetical protein AMEX_G24402 [Astyanax mexicanus]|uniref:Uncharacterized protein n=1 Tax=Astyanax mexicanus TaxID=7994 RepID=A0A8T2KSP6_ASTMX|nr:hypothetical protein AMEX_G24402 [Astyanax mexicanus]